MYFSLLRLDMRSGRRGAALLKNAYALHQRLWRGFACEQEADSDSQFIDAWSPPQEPRANERAFLFRVESDGKARILVQSNGLPDWSRAFRNAPGYLLAPPIVKELNIQLHEGQQLRFRIRANPTKRPPRTKNPSGQIVKESRRPRLAVKEPRRQWRWLEDRFAPAGQIDERFGTIQAEDQTVPYPEKRILTGTKPPRGKSPKQEILVVSQLFEGLLTVTDPDAMKKLLQNGIGPAKSFGCGMLSLSRA